MKDTSVAQIAPQFFHTEAFTMEDGLAHDVIIDFQIDHHGFLWLYSLGGLQLFDGKNFISFNHLIPQHLTYAFFDTYEDDHIFFSHGDQLFDLDVTEYKNDSVPTINLPKSPESKRINLILYENTQNLFLWHRNDSVYQIDKTTFSIKSSFLLPVMPHERRSLPGAGMFLSKERCLIYIGDDHDVYKYILETGQHERLFTSPAFNSAMFASKDTLITLSAHHLHVFASGYVDSIELPAAQRDLLGHYLFLQKPGHILVALEGTIYDFHLKDMRWMSRYQKAGGGKLIDIKFRQMQMDKAGNLYYTTLNDGLVHLHPRNPGFEYIGTNELGDNFARRVNISDEHDMVLMGTLEDGLYVFDSSGTEIMHYLDFPDGRRQRYISMILKITESRFLIIGDAAYQLWITPTGLKMEAVEGLNPSWTNYYDTEIASSKPNVFYVNSFDGLLTCDVTNTVSFNFEPGHPLNSSMATIPFADGYISALGGTLKVFDRSLSQVIDTLQVPLVKATRAIASYGSDHILLGSDQGLFLVSVGTEAKIVRKLHDKLVYAILAGDNAGEYWFSTDHGLYCLQKDLQIRHYSKESGLQENEFNTSTCVKSATGKLYFGGVNGITAFYPSQVSVVTDSIQHYIVQITVNNQVVDRYLPQSSTQRYTTSHSENNISIDLLGRGNKSPKNYNYQYLMAGLTDQWVDLGNTTKVNFHLTPGRYRFYYRIGDNFDPMATASAYISIVIRQPIYKRWWFVTWVFVVLFGLLYYLYAAHRKRQLLKANYEKELNQNLQRERMRISRELHDNIGAQMATVKRSMNFLVSNSSSLSPDQILHKIQDLEGVSTQINQELRDTIWATQHEHITMQDFISRVKSFVFQTLGPESPIRVHYAERADEQAIFGPFVTLNLHRICQEAVHNIVKHSEATDIYISFESRNHHFIVTISDNGKGFDPQNATMGYGLQNMRHRASVVGADLNFESKPNEGTTLIITVNRLTMSDSNT